VPPEKRKRTETSCDKCKSRKQKCRKELGQDACRYCIAHKIECLTTQPRKKRLYGSVEGLGHRLALLESLVKGLLPEADVSSMEAMRRLGGSLGIPLPEAATATVTVTGGAAEAEKSRSSSGTDVEEPLSLLPDQQGQAQYIGPASSFGFHLKLTSLVGQSGAREFVLFGRNAADETPLEGSTSDPHALSKPTNNSSIGLSSAGGHRATTSWSDVPCCDAGRLMDAYFARINPDFPVLHEASFRSAYEQWRVKPEKADPAWFCSLLCMMLLSRRVAGVKCPDEQERMWWRRIQSLLPVVIFTSSLSAVQALMLAALHLHNTNHRDACWNLTGTAIRIGMAIGLHQDKVTTTQTPLTRELRKRLWWTLYAFEQMQVSSYDRPSAIENPGCKVGCPNERVIAMANYCPESYSEWFNRLLVLLASACRAPRNTKMNASEDSYVGPSSPAAGVLRDLDRWKDTLPPHLSMEAIDTARDSFQRPLLLLHAKFHYTVIVLCRCALLSRATTIRRERKDSTNTALTAMADRCTHSGRALAQNVLKLDTIAKFDPITWWDIWYCLASASILVLDIVCTLQRDGGDVSQSRDLLSQLAGLTTKHGRDPDMPGTIEKWASIVPELHTMIHQMDIVAPVAKIEPIEPPAQPDTSRQTSQALLQDIPAYHFPQSTTNSGAYMFADDISTARLYPGSGFASVDPSFQGTRYERGTQLTPMDFTLHNIPDWNWGDLGSLLGHESLSHPPT
jgi:hypothetical protein